MQLLAKNVFFIGAALAAIHMGDRRQHIFGHRHSTFFITGLAKPAGRKKQKPKVQNTDTKSSQYVQNEDTQSSQYVQNTDTKPSNTKNLLR